MAARSPRDETAYISEGLRRAMAACDDEAETVRRMATAFAQNASPTSTCFGLVPGSDELAAAYGGAHPGQAGHDDGRYNEVRLYLEDLATALAEAGAALRASKRNYADAQHASTIGRSN
ncbi:hypothetical protein [Streptosporangium sp. NPDC000396]|uniref:hypothetical protein n=1 Tax=Streptosporangium sp. NPDC000396 TaxID=3366185 RepID=UPI00367D1B9A